MAFPGALFGPQVKYGSSEAQRQQAIAQQLLRAGVNTSPVQGGIGEALARVGTAGIGGYLSNQAGETEKAYNTDRAQTLARALSAGQGLENAPGPNIDGTAGVNVPPDPNRMAQILMGNPSTADLGSQLAIGNMTFARDRAAKKEDVADERGFRKEMFGMERQAKLEDTDLSQRFQREMAAMQQAQAQGNMQLAQQHAMNMQKMQQDFTAQQNQLTREAQAPTQQLNQMLTAQKIQAGQQELQDAAKSKTEAVVSTDRMIRSIDELMGNPDEKLPEHGGFSGAVGAPGVGKLIAMVPGTEGASFKVRLETLKSQAFLPMVAQLKGMGQLSDAEGKKLTAAIGALDTNMSEKEFRASMAEIRNDLVQARNRMGAPEKSTAPRPEAPQTKPRLRFNPETGELE